MTSQGRPRTGNNLKLALTDEMHVFIETQATKHGVSMSKWVRQLIVCAQQVENEKVDTAVGRRAKRHERKRRR